MAICAACGQKNPDRASGRFCNACGASLELATDAREERKVVTVLFADLIGLALARELLSLQGDWVWSRIDLAWVAERLGVDRELRGQFEMMHPSLGLDALRAVLERDFERAAEGFAEIGSLPDEAFARLRAAERLVAEGRVNAADTQLHQALGFWRSVGATRYIREGEALLAAAS
jgi:hypothetical protein